MRRLKILLSAYACEPGKGSEPGVGWNIAREMARHHDVWVLTRANNRTVIEAELARRPIEGIHFAYYDLPAWARFWKRGQRGVHAYYYLWQLGAIRAARRLHRTVGFDLTQHVTFVKYWAPSCLAFLPVPFVWGPVGGGESAPKAFWWGFGPRGIAYETLRELSRCLAGHNPLVRVTARRANIALATTDETADRLRRLGARAVQVLPAVALPSEELETLGHTPEPPDHPIRFVSIGRLLHWKGFHLGLRAFAAAALPDAEYWVIGDGPERRRLERLARSLGVSGSTRFWGMLSRAEVLHLLGNCHVLVHPSLHDSGGWVCIEAMASGRPVICLDLGGPALQVSEEAGIRVPAADPAQAVRDIARAMELLVSSPSIRKELGDRGSKRANSLFSASCLADRVSHAYHLASHGHEVT